MSQTLTVQQDGQTTVIGLNLVKSSVISVGRQGPPGRDGAVVSHYDFEPALIWRVEHNKGTKSFCERLTDAEGWRFIAPLKIIDENVFEIYLAEATGGSVDVIFNGVFA